MIAELPEMEREEQLDVIEAEKEEWVLYKGTRTQKPNVPKWNM